MRLSCISKSLPLLLTAILPLASLASATKLIKSNSLNPCQANSGFTATLFDVVFTPGNGTLSYNINGISSITGNIIADLQVLAYGYTAFNQTIDPCTSPELSSLCPMNPGQIIINSNSQFSQSVVKNIPGIAYSVPDLDGLVKILIYNKATKQQVACVEAELSNGQTVDQVAVQWTTAVIAGLALLASAVTSGLGHSNTAAHVAANALSLFGFFQAQAMIGMTAVELPPIVQSWTQNFQWSMGIVSIQFMQNILTWYQRSTGGKPSTLLSTLATTSVEVQKRSLKVAEKLIMNAFHEVVKRQTTPTTATSTTTVTVLRGIKRVGFRAGIETTNIFLTGLAFFIAFIVIVALCVALFKGACELAVKAGWLKGEKFQDFRNGWRIVLKGILFRLVSRLRLEISISMLTEVDTHWLPPDGYTVPLGVDSKGFRRGGGTCTILFHCHERRSAVGCFQSYPHRKAISYHAQESCLHPVFRSHSIEQMGIPLCSVPCYCILFYSTFPSIHSLQGSLHCVCSIRVNGSSYCSCHYRSSRSHRRQHSPTVDGQKDERL